MDDEQKKWHEQYSANFGAREFLRLGCAIVLWIFTGAAISVALELIGYSAGVFVIAIFFIATFMFAFTAWSWKPAYALLRIILGKDNLPAEPPPRSTAKIPRQPRPWWSFLPGIWFGLMSLFLLYLAIKYLSK